MSTEFLLKLNESPQDLAETARAAGLDYGQYDHFYRLSCHKNGTCGVLFCPQIRARGIEASLEGDELHLRLLSPTSPAEISCCYQTIEKLARRYGAGQIWRNGQPADLARRKEYEREDAAASLAALEELFAPALVQGVPYVTLMGLYYPVSIGLQELRSFQGELAAFGRWLQKIQSASCYYSAPMIFERPDGSCFGIYAYFEPQKTILPQDPEFMIEAEFDCDAWHVMISCEYAVTFTDFLAFMPFQRYDAAHILPLLAAGEFQNQCPELLIPVADL